MKGVTIFYFSGTGNSFYVAREIAERMEGELIPIVLLDNSENIELSTEITGIVYPDYHSSLPNIVKRFINRLVGLEGKYIFGVCTYAGAGPGLAITYLRELIELKGGNLAAGFAVRMPYNYIVPTFKFGNPIIQVKLKPDSKELKRKKFLECENSLKEIVDYVEQRRTGIFESSGELLLKIIDKLRLKDSLGTYMWMRIAGYSGETYEEFSENWRLMDHGFLVDDTCTSCRTCERVCPVNNIIMKENKPSWKHECEQCFACLQWCPQSAIQFGNYTRLDQRYHHPEVDVSDLFLDERISK